LNVLKDEAISGFAGMTPIWLKLFNEKYSPPTDYDFPQLRYITNTGGKVPHEIVKRMRDFFPHTEIFLMYGLTEAFRSTYLPPEQLEKRPDSMGRAIPNVEVLVINDQGKECASGEPGELVHRGALITRGYWNDPARTAEVFRKNPLLEGQEHLNEIVVYSGDLVKKDEDGFFYFLSRRDEMIKSSGYRVSPTEVEEVLIEIPGVRNAVVFGKEIETAEQLIVAVIETDGPAIDGKTVIQESMKRLPLYMVPTEVYVETRFKTTANGKIDRSYLKQKYAG
jgi:acyl-CoA synthetase (AMP-forming)/AMP-acid ligase II